MKQAWVRDRFDGHILGVGTASGRRFVVGVWDCSPLGSFADVMAAHPDGRRELLAPADNVADYVSRTYHFDQVTITPVDVDPPRTTRGSWSVHAGPLTLTIDVGRRTALSTPLLPIRGPLVHPVTARLINPVARVLLPGVRTAGTAGNDRREFYLAQDLHRIDAITGTWAGQDTGPLRDVHPEPHFGFSSTPARPTCTRVTTFVERPPSTT